MRVVIPQSKETVPQLLYRIAARTGIAVDSGRLQPTLTVVKAQERMPAMLESVALELRIDVRSREGMKAATAHVREIAALIEAAADKPRSAEKAELHEVALGNPRDARELDQQLARRRWGRWLGKDPKRCERVVM